MCSSRFRGGIVSRHDRSRARETLKLHKKPTPDGNGGRMCNLTELCWTGNETTNNTAVTVSSGGKQLARNRHNTQNGQGKGFEDNHR